MQHQIAIIQTVFGLRVEGSKMIFFLAGAGHHADIVTATNASRPETPASDAFGVTSQNWVSLRSASFMLDLMLTRTSILRRSLLRLNILHRARFNALITSGRASWYNAVRGHEVNGYGIAAIFIASPIAIPANRQRNERQRARMERYGVLF